VRPETNRLPYPRRVAPSAAGGDFCNAIVEASARLDPDIMVMGISEFVQRVPLSSVDAAAVPMLLIPDAPASRHFLLRQYVGPLQ
jgi:hypothetical protein